jgi:hypothetical protein
LLVNWNRELVDGLDLAFNESTACGLTFDAEAAEARLLIEVLALPEAGPLDRDPRRVAVFSGVSAVEVVLRPEMDNDLGPVLPLESMDALETFFASLGQADAMYGWSFFDIEDPGTDWNQPPSLLLHVPRRTRAHTAFIGSPSVADRLPPTAGSASSSNACFDSRIGGSREPIHEHCPSKRSSRTPRDGGTHSASTTRGYQARRSSKLRRPQRHGEGGAEAP